MDTITTDWTDDRSLTTEQIKALRTAHSVWFKHSLDLAEGEQTYVGASKRFDPKDGFGSRELTVYMPAEPRFTLYTRTGGNDGRRQPTYGFYSITASQYCPEWTTAADSLRKGDKLVTHWTTDSNQRVTDAGLMEIEFRLEVRRPIAKGREKRLVFFLGTHIERLGQQHDIKWTSNPA